MRTILKMYSPKMPSPAPPPWGCHKSVRVMSATADTRKKAPSPTGITI